MKKIVIYILCMVLLCFLIPILFTKQNKVVEVNNKYELKEEKHEETYIDYDYGNFNKIKLLHSASRRSRRIRT